LGALPATAQTTSSGSQDLRTPINTEVPIPIAPELTPGSTSDRIVEYLVAGRVEDLAQYIGIIYNFLLSMVGMVAAVMMVIGGFQYLTSAGDPGRIGAAKSRMANALIGMVLALGAYTILNTINPQLLRLKLPDMRPVTTVLFTLPWCEDLQTGATPVGDSTDCGAVGKYTQGNTSDAPCIYAGKCRAERVSEEVVDVGETPDSDENDGMWRTCVQVQNVQPDVVKAAIAKDKNAKFAQCLHCADMTSKKATQMGFNVASACLAWQSAFESVPAPIKDAIGSAEVKMAIKDGFFHVCYPRTGNQGCMGAAIFCPWVTRNKDCTACSSSKSAGCQGYDESPDPNFARNLDANGFATGRYTYDSDGMEEYPVHLGTLCAQNPCLNYKDPETGETPFARGCKGDNGIVYAAQRVVRHGDIGSIDDCRNQ
jgi:hypothetical protein